MYSTVDRGAYNHNAAENLGFDPGVVRALEILGHVPNDTYIIYGSVCSALELQNPYLQREKKRFAGHSPSRDIDILFIEGRLTDSEIQELNKIVYYESGKCVSLDTRVLQTAESNFIVKGNVIPFGWLSTTIEDISGYNLACLDPTSRLMLRLLFGEPLRVRDSISFNHELSMAVKSGEIFNDKVLYALERLLYSGKALNFFSLGSLKYIIGLMPIEIQEKLRMYYRSGIKDNNLGADPLDNKIRYI